MFTCDFCGSSLIKKSNLLRHMHKFHDVIGLCHGFKLKCFVKGCKFKSATKEEKYFHCRKEHNALLDHLPIPAFYVNAIKSKPIKMPKVRPNEIKNDLWLKKVYNELPPGYEYKVLRCYELKEENMVGYSCDVEFPIEDKFDLKKYVAELSSHSKKRFRMLCTNRQGLHKIWYNCHHDSQKKKTSNKKNTSCPGRLFVKIVKSSDNERLKCFVRHKNLHNHSTENAVALRLLQPSSSVEQKFTGLFEEGCPPMKALKHHEQDLLLKYGDDPYIPLGDRSICPDKAWVYRHNRKIFTAEYGEASGQKMLLSLKEASERINIEAKSICCVVESNEDDSFALALATPLMKRVLKTPLAAEICFLDSTGNVDRYGTRVFLVMTNSPCGGLPVGVLMTTSESEEAIGQALRLHKSLVEEASFGGRGLLGPKHFMTDCCDAERNSLRATYPRAETLLCIFHVLQAVWRWLMDKSNGINAEHRQECYAIFRDIMYSDEVPQTLTNDNLKRYPKFRKYIETEWLPKLKSWALPFRKNVNITGQNTNNINEAAMRVLKDTILDRTRAVSPVHLLDYLNLNFNCHYQKKIISISNGNVDAYLLKKKRKFMDVDSSDYEIKTITRGIFEVHNLKKGTKYLVNSDICICTCPAGDYGSRCKHFAIINEVYGVKHSLNLPDTKEVKAQWYFIATGSNPPNVDWFGPLIEPETSKAQNNEGIVHNYIEQVPLDALPVPTTTHDLINSGPSEILAKLHETFSANLEGISNRAGTNLEIYQTAMEAFNKQCEKLAGKSHAALTSALHCFGKYNGTKARQRNACSSRIGVQPTAIARRRSAYKGRRAAPSGRPPKAARTAEHGYGTDKNKKRTKAPQNLSFCVSENKSLGKKH